MNRWVRPVICRWLGHEFFPFGESGGQILVHCERCGQNDALAPRTARAYYKGKGIYTEDILP